MKTRFAVLGIVCSTLLCVRAFATVTYLGQSRTISAVATDVSDSASASDFLAFNTSVSASSQFGSSGFARQNSSMSPDLILASGSTSGSGGVQLFSGGGSSRFYVSFSFDVPTPFRFTGTWRASGGRSAASVALTGPSGMIYASQSGQIEAEANWGFDGLFAPGEYRLVSAAEGGGAGQFNSGNGSFSMGLFIPSPGSVGILAAAGLIAVRRSRRK